MDAFWRNRFRRAESVWKCPFIEQKNGGLEENRRGDSSSDIGTDEKNVAQQVHRSIDKVREKFNWLNGKVAVSSSITSFTVLTIRSNQVNAAGLNAERIVDAAAKMGCRNESRHYWGPARNATIWYEKVEDFFTKRLTLFPIFIPILVHRKTVRAPKQGVGRYSDQFEMEPFRLKISGAAGSGKEPVCQKVPWIVRYPKTEGSC